MGNVHKVVEITDRVRIETCRDIIRAYRLRNDCKASYELYGISHGSGKIKVVNFGHAPTAADFAPIKSKAQLGQFVALTDIVVEYREAWGKKTEQVIAYESAFAALERAKQ